MSVVKVEFQGDLAIITIDNPPVNALSQSVRSGIVAVMEEVDGNSDAKAAVLICAGPVSYTHLTLPTKTIV